VDAHEGEASGEVSGAELRRVWCASLETLLLAKTLAIPF
jgi:hypothetical protein